MALCQEGLPVIWGFVTQGLIRPRKRYGARCRMDSGPLEPTDYDVPERRTRGTRPTTLARLNTIESYQP